MFVFLNILGFWFAECCLLCEFKVAPSLFHSLSSSLLTPLKFLKPALILKLPTVRVSVSPLHCSVFLIYQMTCHISVSDISLSKAQELHAALRIADNLQTHTHTLYPHLLTLTSVYRVCTQVHIFDTRMSSTTQLSQQSRKNHLDTHNRQKRERALAICRVHSAVASGDNTLHRTKTHHSLHTYLDKALCVCLLAFYSKLEQKSWELN